MTDPFVTSATPLHADGDVVGFAYRRTGRPGGVPLVLLTRFRGTIDDWDPLFLHALGERREVIVVDYPGTGSSTGQPRDSMAGLAQAVIEFVGLLGLAEVDLLGWSLGGAVAQFVVDARPELVRRVVVAASTPGSVPGTTGPDPRVQRIQTDPAATADDLAYLFYPETDAGRAAARASAARIERVRPPGSPGVTEEAATRQLVAAGAAYGIGVDDLVARLARLRSRVLFANGLQDVGIPALDSVFGARHAPDAAVLLYGDAGHAFLFRHAERFAAEVDLFLSA